MSYQFLPGAEAEYLEAVRFFEEQCPGLGASLINEFERVIALAVERPGAWKQVHPSGIRRIGLRRFPFAVFFHPGSENQLLLVTAFAHHRRRPGYWLQRVGAP